MQRMINQANDRQSIPSILSAIAQAIVEVTRTWNLLPAVRWRPELEAEFLANHGLEPPFHPTQHPFAQPLPANLDSGAKRLDRLAVHLRQTESGHPFARFLCQRLEQAHRLRDWLQARGTPRFAEYARAIFGTTKPNHPNSVDPDAILACFHRYQTHAEIPPDSPTISAPLALQELQQRLSEYFADTPQTLVCLSDHLTANAAVRSEILYLKADATFSAADVAMLEVHEGWIHQGTSRNARQGSRLRLFQRPTPESTRLQEGLAVAAELLFQTAGPRRIRKHQARVQAIQMAESGSDFRQIFRMLGEMGMPPREAYQQTMRIFRGCPLDGAPFTKDLCYGAGLLQTLTWLRDWADAPAPERLQAIFAGKFAWEELPLVESGLRDGWLRTPRYLPRPFRDAKWVRESVSRYLPPAN
ncbi:tyrosine/phenylalanine carboxypeptidase domain-containing protein [Tuwongella immobilis]|nr:tyrosine/phenylalanine carboxypeptidase domain-containing protein [Tuwongella immobilis]